MCVDLGQGEKERVNREILIWDYVYNKSVLRRDRERVKMRSS